MLASGVGRRCPRPYSDGFVLVSLHGIYSDTLCAGLPSWHPIGTLCAGLPSWHPTGTLCAPSRAADGPAQWEEGTTSCHHRVYPVVRSKKFMSVEPVLEDHCHHEAEVPTPGRRGQNCAIKQFQDSNTRPPPPRRCCGMVEGKAKMWTGSSSNSAWSQNVTCISILLLSSLFCLFCCVACCVDLLNYVTAFH